MKDIIGRRLAVGDWVVFSRPAYGGGRGSSCVDVGTITKYNSYTNFVSIKLLLPGDYDWNNKTISTKFVPAKFYRVDKQL